MCKKKFPDAIAKGIVDPKFTIFHFFAGRGTSGDCGFKMNDFPFFPGREIDGDCRPKMNEFPFFSRTRYRDVRGVASGTDL